MTKASLAVIQEAAKEADEEIFLLCCGLRHLMGKETCRELESLWRLTDYLAQHVGEIRKFS